MSKQEAIRNAARAVKAHGLSLPAELDKQIAGLENPQYRVAVVGEYQVGKSTLINRVFLGDKPLLTEGRGLCTTAVATDIEYGSAPTLEVYDWTDEHQTKTTLVETIQDPSMHDVNRVTVSSSMETRAELAKKRARVRVTTPNEALQGYTVVDTPGLNDPERELLLNTTWRIIPNSDVVLLVTKGDRTLDDVERTLLQNKIMGEKGIARIMVLMSFQPAKMPQNDQKRAEIVEDVRADLAEMNRGTIPVEMYCFEDDERFGDILNNVPDILQTIRSYLKENALPGREERIANLVRAEIEKDLVDISAKLAASGKTAEERAALAAKVEAEVTRFKEKAERAFDRFQTEVQDLNDDLMNDVDNAVELVFNKFVADLKARDSIGEKKKLLAKAEVVIKEGLDSKVSVLTLKLKTEISELVRQYGKDMEEVRRRWNVFLSEEFQIKKPFVAKIPSIVWDGLEIVLLNLVLPMGWITAIVAHLMGKSFFNPAAAVGKFLIDDGVEKGLEESKGEVRTQIMQQIDEAVKKTFADIKDGMEESNQAQVASIRAALAADPADSGDRAALESAKADLESALAAL